MTDPVHVRCSWQRLDPPYQSEPVESWARVYQNALVVELDGGGRLVFDRDELAEVCKRPPLRVA